MLTDFRLIWIGFEDKRKKKKNTLESLIFQQQHNEQYQNLHNTYFFSFLFTQRKTSVK